MVKLQKQYLASNENGAIVADMNEQMIMFELDETERNLHVKEYKLQLHKIVLQIKVTLQIIRPPIWRRLLIPADMPFRMLHETIQRAFDWDDEHLYSFEVPLPNRERILIDNEGPKNPFSFLGIGRDEHRDEATTLVGEVLQKKKAKCIYWYDFRVDWKHDILVEEILPTEKGVRYPVCIKGKRAAAFEDCCGPWRYMQFVEALRDPKHPDRQERDWLYEKMGDFDPEEFHLDIINEQLQDPYQTQEEYEKLWASRGIR